MQCCCGEASGKGYDANVVQEACEAWEDVAVRDANFFFADACRIHRVTGNLIKGP